MLRLEIPRFVLRDGPVVYPPDALIRWRQLKLLIPHHRVTIQQWEKQGTFPKRVHTSKQGRAWRLRDVLAWIEARNATTAESPTPVEVQPPTGAALRRR